MEQEEGGVNRDTIGLVMVSRPIIEVELMFTGPALRERNRKEVNDYLQPKKPERYDRERTRARQLQYLQAWLFLSMGLL